MSETSPSPAHEWLAVSGTQEPDVYRIDFQEHHIGNPIIRSVHGGVVGALVEAASEGLLLKELERKRIAANVEVTTSSINYLRVTKDAPLFARAEVVRIARRIGFMDVRIWQDEESLPVAHGTCTLRILSEVEMGN